MTITVSNCGTIMTWGVHMWDEDRLTQGEMPSIKNRVYRELGEQRESLSLCCEKTEDMEPLQGHPGQLSRRGLLGMGPLTRSVGEESSQAPALSRALFSPFPHAGLV